MIHFLKKGVRYILYPVEKLHKFLIKIIQYFVNHEREFQDKINKNMRGLREQMKEMEDFPLKGLSTTIASGALWIPQIILLSLYPLLTIVTGALYFGVFIFLPFYLLIKLLIFFRISVGWSIVISFCILLLLPSIYPLWKAITTSRKSKNS